MKRGQWMILVGSAFCAGLSAGIAFVLWVTDPRFDRDLDAIVDPQAGDNPVDEPFLVDHGWHEAGSWPGPRPLRDGLDPEAFEASIRFEG